MNPSQGRRCPKCFAVYAFEATRCPLCGQDYRDSLSPPQIVDVRTDPLGTRQELLDRIRNQIGLTNYQGLVARVGEDRLLDLIEPRAHGTDDVKPGYFYSPQTPTCPARRGSLWRKAWGVVSAFLFQYNGLVTVATALGGLGPVGVVVVIGALLLLYLCAVLFFWAGEPEIVSSGLAWVLGIAGVISLVTLAGYLTWKGVPWLVSGVGQWWKWLGGHFYG